MRLTGAAATMLLASDPGCYSTGRVYLTPPTRETTRHTACKWFLCSDIIGDLFNNVLAVLIWGLIRAPPPPPIFFPLLEAATAPPRPPCSVSITGNNRPVVFHRRAWRRFPLRCHEVSAVPARQSAHLGNTAGGGRWGWVERERERTSVSFLISLWSSEEGSDAWPCIAHIREWYEMNKRPVRRRSHWKDFYKPHKAANWQGPH